MDGNRPAYFSSSFFFLNRYSSTLLRISSLILRSMGKNAAFATRCVRYSACRSVMSSACSSM